MSSNTLNTTVIEAINNSNNSLEQLVNTFVDQNKNAADGENQKESCDVSFIRAIATFTSDKINADRIDTLIDEAAEKSDTKHRQFLNELETMAISFGADPDIVKKLARNIDDEFISGYVLTGFDLYLQGLVDGIKLMGQEININDLKAAREEIIKENWNKLVEEIKTGAA